MLDIRLKGRWAKHTVKPTVRIWGDRRGIRDSGLYQSVERKDHYAIFRRPPSRHKFTPVEKLTLFGTRKFSVFVPHSEFITYVGDSLEEVEPAPEESYVSLTFTLTGQTADEPTVLLRVSPDDPRSDVQSKRVCTLLDWRHRRLRSLAIDRLDAG